jgi:hypothetical protein
MTDLSERIAELREIARDEGNDFNEQSLLAFMVFMRLTGASQPALFLRYDGNFDAVWVYKSQRAKIKFDGDTISWRWRDVGENKS